MSQEDNEVRDDCKCPDEGSSNEELYALIRDLESENDELRSEVESYKDSLARARADYQNLKKRNERLMGKMETRMMGEIVCRFLPIIDDLRQVIESTGDRAEDPVRLGVKQILDKAEDSLQSMGVFKISCRGEQFDPNWHEAIDYVPSDRLPDGIIIEEVSTGYAMEDNLLRPARVLVARGGADDDESSSGDRNEEAREER